MVVAYRKVHSSRAASKDEVLIKNVHTHKGCMGLFEMYSKLTWGQTLNLNQLQILTAQDHGVVVIQGLHNTKDCRLAARRHAVFQCWGLRSGVRG